MALTTSWMFRTALGVILPLAAGCGAMAAGPPVRSVSQCTLAWDRVENPAVTEYRVAIWPDPSTANAPKQTFRVTAPTTAVPCKTAGANHDGTWRATVQACTKAKVCSEPSKPFTFIVGAK